MPVNNKVVHLPSIRGFGNPPTAEGIYEHVSGDKEQQGVDLWPMAQHQPHMFRKGGNYYEQILQTYGENLKHLTHFQFEEFPNKTFAYNAHDQRLDLCLGADHLPVGPLTHEQVGCVIW